MLHVGVQNSRAVCRLIDQRRAIGTQAEQRQVQQRQAHAGHQTSPDGVASQQSGFANAAGTRGIDDNDTEDHRPQRVHGQIAIDETIRERRGTIGFHRVANRASRPDNRGHREHDQGDNFQRRQEIADGIQQFARIEGNQDHQREIDNAIDKQRQRAVAGQRSNPHFK